MKKYAFLAAVLVLPALLPSCATTKPSEKGGKTDSGIDPMMAFAAEEANKLMPVDIDDFSRVERVEALPDKGFRYVYVLKQISKSDTDMALLKNALEPLILTNLESEDALGMFRERDINLQILFLDMNGDEAFSIDYPAGTY